MPADMKQIHTRFTPGQSVYRIREDGQIWPCDVTKILVEFSLILYYVSDAPAPGEHNWPEPVLQTFAAYVPEHVVRYDQTPDSYIYGRPEEAAAYMVSYHVNKFNIKSPES